MTPTEPIMTRDTLQTRATNLLQEHLDRAGANLAYILRDEKPAGIPAPDLTKHPEMAVAHSGAAGAELMRAAGDSPTGTTTAGPSEDAARKANPVTAAMIATGGLAAAIKRGQENRLLRAAGVKIVPPPGPKPRPKTRNKRKKKHK